MVNTAEAEAEATRVTMAAELQNTEREHTRHAYALERVMAQVPLRMHVAACNGRV